MAGSHIPGSPHGAHEAALWPDEPSHSVRPALMPHRPWRLRDHFSGGKLLIIFGISLVPGAGQMPLACQSRLAGA
jgi:hypothetical protein